MSEHTLPLRDGKPIQEALDQEHIDVRELEMAARQHGIADLADVTAAILEEDGSISIIPKDGRTSGAARATSVNSATADARGR